MTGPADKDAQARTNTGGVPRLAETGDAFARAHENEFALRIPGALDAEHL
jgi:hypothetical protein